MIRGISLKWHGKWWVSIDPGLECSGWALWYDDVLIDCGVSFRNKKLDNNLAWGLHSKEIKNKIAAHFAKSLVKIPKLSCVVTECPVVYRFSKINPAGLIQVAAVMGAVTSKLNPAWVVTYLPRHWKGSRDKAVTIEAVNGLLDANERAAISSVPITKTYAHNLWDAVGIGLWHCGRLQWNVSEPKKIKKVKNGTKPHQKPKPRGKPTSKPAKKTLLNASID